VSTRRSGKADGRPGDLDALQGTWHLVSLEVDGRAMPAVDAAGAHIVITRGTFVSVGMSGTYEGTVEVDQTKTPRQIDLTFTAGHAAGTRNPGIYRLDGDAWTLCLATRGSRRPRTFATMPASGLALETFRRTATQRKAAKADPHVAPSDVEAGPATDWEGEWTMVTGVFNGAAMDARMVEWCRRITHGNVTSVVAGPQIMLKATFTLDRSEHPNTVDYLNLEGTHKGKAQAGIFQAGGGMLTVCMAAPGQPRPKDFTSVSGDGRSLTTWRLAKRGG
jgi:uncharacterized protein (TIGR03067 family)